MTFDMFHLAWRDFELFMSDSYKHLLNNQTFADVTLATEDDQQIKAHKVILSASSPVLKSILEKHPHQHPLIYLSGIKYDELRSIIDFIYVGKTEVSQDMLKMFMGTATKFKVKGLSNCQINEQSKEPKLAKQGHEDENDENKSVPLDFHVDSQESKIEPSEELTDFGAEEPISVKSTRNDQQIVEDYYRCQYCDYKSNIRGNVNVHAKSQHEGKRFPCHFCEYESKYNQDLLKHIGRKHLYNKYTSKRVLEKNFKI